MTVRRQIPRQVVLRTGVDLGPPEHRTAVYALADVVATRHWRIAHSELARIWVEPRSGLTLECRWDRGFDLENAVEVFEDEVYLAPVTGHVVIDVGAGSGDSALFSWLNGARRVVAYEPNPESAQLARRNVLANGAEQVIELHDEAIGGARGTRALRYPAGVPSAASLLPGRDALERWRFDVVSPVQVLTLDEIVELSGESRVALLKLDCQGAEYEILGAATRALPRIDRVILEFTQGPRDLPELFERSGFRVQYDRTSRGYLSAVREDWVQS